MVKLYITSLALSKKLILDENIDHGLSKEIYIKCVTDYIVDWLNKIYELGAHQSIAGGYTACFRRIKISENCLQIFLLLLALELRQTK